MKKKGFKLIVLACHNTDVINPNVIITALDSGPFMIDIGLNSVYLLSDSVWTNTFF